MAQSSTFPAFSYSPPEEYVSQDMATTVERIMKKYANNLMRFLQGISSRLSQLEFYSYNLDKSVGEMRTKLARDNGKADSKLKFIQKHLQEVLYNLIEMIIYPAPVSLVRDHTIKQKLGELGISVESYNGDLLYEPWEIYDSEGHAFTTFDACDLLSLCEARFHARL